MIAACPQCGARYRIERERLPAKGARLRCSRCEAIFRVSPPGSEAAAPPPAPQPQPAPPSAPPPPAAPQVPSPAPPHGTPPEAPHGAPPEAPQRPASSPSHTAPRPLVLVADPDVEAGKGLAGALAAAGVEPILVHDGVEAILTVQRTLPSLVVLEASLPKMFGFQVCELMKRNEQLRAIPVVLVGSIHHRDRYRRQAAETYGADGYLERPGLAESLLSTLRQCGILAGSAAPVAAPPEAPPPRPDPAPAPTAPPPPRPTAPPEPVRSPPPPPAPAPVAAPAPAPGPDPETAADIARAERLARIIVSDIVLYNPERFELAMRSGDVVAAMATEMEEGRAHFRERIAERIRERRDFLGEELVRVARLRGME